MKRVVITVIKAYRIIFKPLVKSAGVRCYFTPSCSQYTLDAVEKYGVYAGLTKGFKRIFRCNPYFTGNHIDKA